MLSLRRSFFAVVVAFLSANLLAIEQPEATAIAQQQADIRIDAELNEPAWQQASRLTLDYITFPDDKAPAPVATEVRFFEDGQQLYVAFIAKEHDPSTIRAFYRRRDNIWSDEIVGVKLDPYNDHRLAFQFFVNPLGVQMDSIENAITGSESNAWDGIWDAAGQITNNGFVVEIAIPFRNFNFDPSTKPQDWAVEFLRYRPRDKYLRLSHIPIDRDNDCWVCQMVPIRGFAGAQQGEKFTLVPTLVGGRSEQRSRAIGAEYEGGNILEPGLDVKWNPNASTSVNVTLNPDFSQVEADAAQLDLNTNFTLFFPERRPFFLENQDIFSTDLNLVFTRNVGAPDYGLKASGRNGAHAFGVFAANDVNTTFLVPGNLGSGVAQLASQSLNAATRYRYDASNGLSVGWLGTFRSADDYHNYVSAVDVRYRITDSDELRVQTALSNTQYPLELAEQFCQGDGCREAERESCTFNSCLFSEQVLRTLDTDDFSDQALRVRYDHESKHLFLRGRYFETGADFRTDLGFLTQVDRNSWVAGGGYRWFPEEGQDRWWNQITINGDWDIHHNDNGELLEREVEAYLSVDAALQSYVEFGCRRNQFVGNRFDPSRLAIDGNTTLFDQRNCILYAEFQPFSGFFAGVFLDSGDEIDFANNRLGQKRVLNPSIEYSVNANLRAELDYEYRSLEADGVEVFNAHQADLRINYNFDLLNELRLNLIYTNIDFNLANQPGLLPEALPSSRNESLATQLIYTYRINPQTAFFAGYSDAASAFDGRQDLRRDNRSLFLKLTYAFFL